VKLHDLKPAPGSRKRRTRVGRGIAAGKGKTAGRGTKGQKSRSGGNLPPWFEGGQTPIHIRVPKLRGFKQRDRIEYQVVNVGRIAEYATAGRFGTDAAGKEPLTINADVLSAAGLIAKVDRPVKVLGAGDIDIKLFVAAERFTAGARSKIEGAGGFVQLLAPEPEPEAKPKELDKTEPDSEGGPTAEAVAEVEVSADDAPLAEDAAPADVDMGADDAAPAEADDSEKETQ
jgi:large subunit ribosomal protein L15